MEGVDQCGVALRGGSCSVRSGASWRELIMTCVGSVEGVDHDTDTAESAGPYKAKHGSHNIVNPHLYRFN